MKNNEITNAIIQERFGKDSLIALATVDGDIPAVRTVNTVYIDGAFYVVTYALSGKMKQIAKNPPSLFAATGLLPMEWARILVMYCWKRIRILWKSCVRLSRHGTITGIPTKRIPIPVC